MDPGAAPAFPGVFWGGNSSFREGMGILVLGNAVFRELHFREFSFCGRGGNVIFRECFSHSQ